MNIKRFGVVLTLGLLVSTNVFGQWNKLMKFPQVSYDYISNATIVEEDMIVVNTWNSCYYSYDNGSNWDSIVGYAGYFENASILYGTKNGSLYYSTDTGKNWTLKSKVGFEKFYNLKNGNIAIQTYDNKFLTSNDYGALWKLMSLPNYLYSGTTTIGQVFPKTLDDLQMVVYEINSQKNEQTPYLIRTKNGGLTWDTTKIRNGRYGYWNTSYPQRDSLIFLPGWEIVIKNLNTGLWDTTDFFIYGDNWGPTVMAFYENQIVVGCTLSYSPDSTFAVSNDFGKTWVWQKNDSIAPNPGSYSQGSEIILFKKNYGILCFDHGVYLWDERCQEKPGFLGQNVVACDSSMIDASLKITADSFIWSDGTKGASRTFLSNSTISVKANLNNCSYLDTIEVTINQSPNKPTISIDVQNKITSTSSLTHTWYRNDTIISGKTSNTLDASKTGSYYCIVTDKNGCSSDTSNRINSMSSVQKLDFNHAFKLYPNPSNGKFFIETNGLNAREIISIDLFTFHGQHIPVNISTLNSSFEVSYESASQNLQLVITTSKGIFSTVLSNLGN